MRGASLEIYRRSAFDKEYRTMIARNFFRGLRIRFATALAMFSLAAAAHAQINTTDGSIPVTPGTVGYLEVGKYLSGGDGLVGISGIYPFGPPPAVAASNLDHFWLQGDTYHPITWQFTTGYNAFAAFPGIDHGPVPEESLEYTLWASNDLSNWEEGKITGVSQSGWDLTNTFIGHSDDYTGLWGFTQNYKYLRATTGDHLLPHYNSPDFEMDGVAALGKASSVPEPGATAFLGAGLTTGLFGMVLRRKQAVR
jgi:hypothetical protein